MMAHPTTRTSVLDPDIVEAIEREFHTRTVAYDKLELDSFVGKDTFYRALRGEPCDERHIGTIKLCLGFYRNLIFKESYVIEAVKAAVKKMVELTGKSVNYADVLHDIMRLNDTGKLDDAL